MKVRFGQCQIQLVLGNIVGVSADAIVNAANSELAGGGGVDGAIHRAAGPEVMRETSLRYPEGCPTGDAVVSGAGNLSAKFIFHAVGPVWQGGHHGEEELLRSAVRKCLELARQHDCRQIAFPALSTGAYGYPRDLAAVAMLDEVRTFLLAESRPENVQVVLFDEGLYGAFARVLEQLR